MASANSYHGRLRKVEAFDEIKTGMHVCWRVLDSSAGVDESHGCYHHAIVTMVDYKSQCIALIRLKKGRNSAKITENVISSITKIDLPNMYYVHYEDGQSMDDDTLIDNVRKRIGQRIKFSYDNDGYNFFLEYKERKDFKKQVVVASEEPKKSKGPVVERSVIYEDRLRKVESISDISIGMHILWWRQYVRSIGYYHHAIVSIVDCTAPNPYIVVIHLQEDENEGQTTDQKSWISEIVESKPMRGNQIDINNLYYIKYEKDECLSDDEVVTNACSKIGQRQEYNCFTNNCEHFAFKCKTGQGLSEQAKRIERLKESADSLSSSMPKSSIPESFMSFLDAGVMILRSSMLSSMPKS